MDTISHSMGTCITRYFLEMLDGAHHTAHVRQLIGLDPPNNGSALARLFNDPEHGATIINRLTGIFVTEGFDPEKDLIVQDVRPESRVMTELRSAGIRKDILYRIIVTGNPEGIPAFFPHFAGKTWEIGTDCRYRQTLAGDGVVPTASPPSPASRLTSSHPARMHQANTRARTCSVISTCQETRPSSTASYSTSLQLSSKL